MFPDDKKAVLGPGKLLQIAREEKNLRPEDVAYEIRLTPSQVLALDEDDYSRMPEETYVRGYLRNYARLVGVPENDILMAFARMTRAKDASATPASLPSESVKDTNGRVVWFAAIAGIIAIIAVSAVWILQPFDELPLTESSTDAPVVEEKPVHEEVPVGSSTLTLDTTAADRDLDVKPVSPEGETATDSQVQLEGISENVTKLEIPATVESVNSVETVETANVGNNQINTGEGVLLISYSKDSWTDVRDARGRKLLYRTVKAGEKVALAGELPISLFFGFAQGVNVKFNGKEIDVSAHTRGVFARFSVGEKTVNP